MEEDLSESQPETIQEEGENFSYDHTIPMKARLKVFKNETEVKGPIFCSVEKWKDEKAYLKQQKKVFGVDTVSPQK